MHHSCLLRRPWLSCSFGDIPFGALVLIGSYRNNINTGALETTHEVNAVLNAWTSIKTGMVCRQSLIRAKPSSFRLPKGIEWKLNMSQNNTCDDKNVEARISRLESELANERARREAAQYKWQCARCHRKFKTLWQYFKHDC